MARTWPLMQCSLSTRFKSSVPWLRMPDPRRRVLELGITREFRRDLACCHGSVRPRLWFGGMLGVVADLAFLGADSASVLSVGIDETVDASVMAVATTDGLFLPLDAKGVELVVELPAAHAEFVHGLSLGEAAGHHGVDEFCSEGD